MKRADGAADPFEAAYSRKLVVNVQDYVRRFAGLEDGEARERLQEFLERLIKENPGVVAVMDEIGCGIVPVGREERLWRDLAGEAAQTPGSLFQGRIPGHRRPGPGTEGR